MTVEDRLDPAWIKTVLPNMAPVPDEEFQTTMTRKGGWKQVERIIHRSYAAITQDMDLVLYIDPKGNLFMVQRFVEMWDAVVPGDVPLERNADGLIVPSMGDLSLLGLERWEPMEAAQFSDTALNYLAVNGRRPFKPKKWISVMKQANYAEVKDTFHRIDDWRRTWEERTGEGYKPTQDDVPFEYEAFINSL